MFRSSGISRQHICQKRNEFLPGISLVFYCYENPSIAHITLEPLVWFRLGFQQCTSPNEHFNQIENWKCNMFYFRVISLDCIKYFVFHPGHVNCPWNLCANISYYVKRILIPSLTTILTYCTTNSRWPPNNTGQFLKCSSDRLPSVPFLCFNNSTRSQSRQLPTIPIDCFSKKKTE